MTTLGRAIKAINPDAAFTFNDNDLDTIQWNEGTSPISKADILSKQTELIELKKTLDAKKETDKSNANQKLKDLGLTDDEIKAIKGID
tara:strand:- start:16 stop:279 length:264 start_codon:yes stop_codon:yes gene_type:complete